MALTFDKLPDSAAGNLEPGIHKLTIIKAEPQLAGTGAKMLQCSYTIDDTDVTLNYDNYVITKADGRDNNYGLAKLKKVLKAINVVPVGEFTVKTIAPLMVGHSFMVELVRPGKYLEFGNIDTIAPIQDVKNKTNPSLGEKEVNLGLDDEPINTEPDW